MSERFGKYEILRRIGVGGMGEVYVARAHGAEGFVKEVVIKRILPAYTEDPEFVEMFIREARLAARLRHANIVQILDFDQVDGQYYIAMEWIDGPDLRRVQSTSRRRGMEVPPTLAVHVAIEALKGLHYAHTRSEAGQELGIVHRDISPHNLLVSLAGEVKIADFGVAKVAALASSTGAGVLKGKLTYMAPEQLDGSQVDQRCDLFALGVVLWELLAGRRLYAETLSHAELIAAVQRCEIPPLQDLVESLPEGLAPAVQRLLSPSPDQRYQRAAEALPAFSAVAGGGDALAVSEYLRRLLPEDAERDLKGGTVANAAASPIPRRAGAAAETQTRQKSDPSGPAAEPGSASIPSGAASQRAADSSAASAPEAVIVDGGAMSVVSEAERSAPPTGRLPRVVVRDHVGLLALVGVAIFVTAALVASIWFSDTATQSTARDSAHAESPPRALEAPGVLRVQNTDPPARLRVEGVPLGTEPTARLVAQAGTVLRVTAERGGRIKEHEVRVRAGASESLTLSFAAPVAAPLPKQKAVAAATPAGNTGAAAVRPDSTGAADARRSVAARPLDAGRRAHKRSVARRRASARRVPRESARRGTGSSADRRSELPRGSGKLTVVVYPWADVSIDGRPRGSTPLVGYTLPVGRHVLRLTNGELGRDETVSLAVSAGKTLKIRRNWLR